MRAANQTLLFVPLNKFSPPGLMHTDLPVGVTPLDAAMLKIKKNACDSDC